MDDPCPIPAEQIIAELDSRPHPEGGQYAETYRHAPAGGGRGAMTAIYYLLWAGKISDWHRVNDANEIWHYYAGAPLELRCGRDLLLLGAEVTAGQRSQAVIPMGQSQLARSLGAWTLVGCTVGPAFDFTGFEMAPPDWQPF